MSDPRESCPWKCNHCLCYQGEIDRLTTEGSALKEVADQVRAFLDHYNDDRVWADIRKVREALAKLDAVSGSSKRTCDFVGGTCDNIATSEAMFLDNGKWYACCDNHASYARRSKAHFRDLTDVADQSQEKPSD